MPSKGLKIFLLCSVLKEKVESLLRNTSYVGGTSIFPLCFLRVSSVGPRGLDGLLDWDLKGVQSGIHVII